MFTRITGVSLFCALVSCGALATEGGGGRPLTGQQIQPNAGIVPPIPGAVILQVSSIMYSGSMGGSREVPIGRGISLGLDLDIAYNMANLSYIWNTPAGQWNFASGVGLPFQYTRIKVSASTLRASLEVEDSGTQFADMVIVPIAAGYHFSKTEHLALSLPIFAPTGAYNPDRLANAGQNTWTFSPTVGYTRLFANGSEFSALAAIDLYTRNQATDYQNGAVFRLDALWTAAIAPGWKLGAVGGWIQQLERDSGPSADRLDGFKGYSVGVGPILSWSGKWGRQPASFTARWVHDIDAKNRPKGDGIGLNLVLPFL